jgi:hypothetical protein
VRSSARIPVTGSHTFGLSGTYNIAGVASITTVDLPQDPWRLFQPADPCRVLTIASVLRATNGPTTCSFTGSTAQTVAVADTYTVDAIVVPSNPGVPGNPVAPTDPFVPLGSFAVRYGLAVAADNTITARRPQPTPSPDQGSPEPRRHRIAH